MYYVLIENNEFIGTFNYEPNVPDTVTVVQITDQDHLNIVENKTHYFDISTRSVKSYNQEQLNQVVRDKEIELTNAENREFLNSTDWKVLRHIRQKALGVATSMTEAEYLALEQQRSDAASRIINN